MRTTNRLLIFLATLHYFSYSFATLEELEKLLILQKDYKIALAAWNVEQDENAQEFLRLLNAIKKNIDMERIFLTSSPA